MKHINIPIFIPHLGCPNQCIFCNQRHISGTQVFDETKVRDEVEKVLSTVSDEKCEIAFFGGSFTGIDRGLMLRMLDLAEEFVKSGRVNGIRMSTRPDYITSEIIEILSKYTISCVELGIQTMNDDILQYLKRGHSSFDTIEAVSLLKNAKIPFVGQMMIGLPQATEVDEINCATFIAQNGAFGARIYPTLVFNNTELADIYAQKGYAPLTIDDAVNRAAAVLDIFNQHGIPCIRIGLCDSENLHSEETFVAGPNNPTIGEMVKSRVFYNSIFNKLKDFDKCQSVIIYCPKGKTSQVIGVKKENVNKLKQEFEIKSIKVIEKETLHDFDIDIEIKEEHDAFKVT